MLVRDLSVRLLEVECLLLSFFLSCRSLKYLFSAIGFLTISDHPRDLFFSNFEKSRRLEERKRNKGRINNISSSLVQLPISLPSLSPHRYILLRIPIACLVGVLCNQNGKNLHVPYKKRFRNRHDARFLTNCHIVVYIFLKCTHRPRVLPCVNLLHPLKSPRLVRLAVCVTPVIRYVSVPKNEVQRSTDCNGK